MQRGRGLADMCCSTEGGRGVGLGVLRLSAELVGEEDGWNREWVWWLLLVTEGDV